jgi:Flp pilus assembly pilin Flp
VPAVLHFWRTFGFGRGVLREGGTDTLMTQLLALIPLIRRDGRGQGLAEYALILALIAMVAVIALLFLGGQISTMLNKAGQSV